MRRSAVGMSLVIAIVITLAFGPWLRHDSTRQEILLAGGDWLVSVCTSSARWWWTKTIRRLRAEGQVKDSAYRRRKRHRLMASWPLRFVNWAILLMVLLILAFMVYYRDDHELVGNWAYVVAFTSMFRSMVVASFSHAAEH